MQQELQCIYVYEDIVILSKTLHFLHTNLKDSHVQTAVIFDLSFIAEATLRAINYFAKSFSVFILVVFSD